MPSTTNEGEKLLEEFGRIVVGRFDQSLKSIHATLVSGDRPADRAFRAVIEPLSEVDRSMKIAQYCLEKFIHDFMAAIEDSDVFLISATTDGETILDLKRFSESGLQAEQIYWHEKFSKNHRVTQAVIDIIDSKID